jgi:WD40 repeat protein
MPTTSEEPSRHVTRWIWILVAGIILVFIGSGSALSYLWLIKPSLPLKASAQPSLPEEPSSWIKVDATELTPRSVITAYDREEVKLLEISNDGKAVLSADRDGLVSCCDIAGKLKLRWSTRPKYGPRQAAGCACWSRDGSMIATGGFGGSQILDAKTGETRHELPNVVEEEVLQERPKEARRLPTTVDVGFLDEKSLVTIDSGNLGLPFGQSGNSIVIWELATKQPRRLELAGEGSLELCTFGHFLSSDGKLLVCRQNDLEEKSSILFIEMPSGKKLREHKMSRSTRLAIDPAGALLASADGRQSIPLLGFRDVKGVDLVNVKTGKRQRTLAEDYVVLQLACSKDGKSLIGQTSSRGQPMNISELAVWNVADGKETAHYRIEDEGVSSLAFSLDAKIVITGHQDGKVKLWELP